MAKIESYAQASPVASTDLLIGTDVNANNATKNFSVGDLKSFINGQYSYATTISKAEILTLSGGVVNIVLVPAQGANVITAVQSVMVEIFGTQPYIGSMQGFNIFGGGSLYFMRVANVFNSTVAKRFVVPVNEFPTAGDTTLVPNSNITLTGIVGQAIADSGSSDLTLKITSFYTLINV